MRLWRKKAVETRSSLANPDAVLVDTFAGTSTYSSERVSVESAMSLAFDDNPPSAGQVTTAIAMGDNLIDRLVKAGIAFTVHQDG